MTRMCFICLQAVPVLCAQRFFLLFALSHGLLSRGARRSAERLRSLQNFLRRSKIFSISSVIAGSSQHLSSKEANASVRFEHSRNKYFSPRVSQLAFLRTYVSRGQRTKVEKDKYGKQSPAASMEARWHPHSANVGGNHPDWISAARPGNIFGLLRHFRPFSRPFSIEGGISRREPH